MKEKANNDIRETIFLSRLKQWEVAEQIGIADATFTRWLRTPLNDERKAKVNKAIQELQKG